MADIFISYARSDRARAKVVAEALEQQGYSVWWDPKIPPGRTFDEVIEEALDSANCVLVLWSKDSVSSEWVRTEAAEGKRREILVPALIDDVTIPLAFRLRQAADLTDWEKGKPHSDFDSMIEAISAVVGPPLAQELERKAEEERKRKEQEELERKAEEERKRKEREGLERKAAEEEKRRKEHPEPPKRRPIVVIAPLIGIALILLVGVLWYVQRPKVPSRRAVTPSTQEVPRSTPKVDLQTDRTITNSVGMNFALIKSGTFMMGSPADEPGRDDDEGQHKVSISEPFYLQTTEVTQGQWKAVMGNNPSYFKNCGDECPVEQVSWDDAQELIVKLNRMESTSKYRLPTEAEWEYACRAETLTPFYTGDCISTDQANYDGNYPLTGCSGGKYRKTTVKVGSFEQNAWGLYDMHGNVWEWCQNWYGDYPTGHVTDPKGPPSGSNRVLRGGSLNHEARYVRSAFRLRSFPDLRHGYIGFRVARAP